MVLRSPMLKRASTQRAVTRSALGRGLPSIEELVRIGTGKHVGVGSVSEVELVDRGTVLVGHRLTLRTAKAVGFLVRRGAPPSLVLPPLRKRLGSPCAPRRVAAVPHREC